MTATLRLTDGLHKRLLDTATQPLEHAGVLLAAISDTNGVVTAVGVDWLPVPDDAYERQGVDHLTVTSDGYMPALSIAEQRGLTAIWVHSHPGDGSEVHASDYDARVNQQLGDVFALRTGTDRYGYLVIGHRAGRLTFTGGITGSITSSIDRLTTIGDRFRFETADDNPQHTPTEVYDRNVRAFGPAIQSVIGSLTVAIVGSGGTGSAVAEQLVRLGVRSFLLLDPDTLSASNTTRVYGSTPGDVGRAKVEVLADHLTRIAPDAVVVRQQTSVLQQHAARLLQTADIVFGCTDDNAGRLRLSRLPYFTLTPVIDCGVQIEATPQLTINGIFGRVTTLHPGPACLTCRDRIDLARAMAEERAADEQQALEKEGYAPALGATEPAVVAFTTLVAATAVGELLERLIGYGDTPAPTEQLLMIHDRSIRTNRIPPTPGHYCDPNVVTIGAGATTYLGLNWAS